MNWLKNILLVRFWEWVRGIVNRKIDAAEGKTVPAPAPAKDDRPHDSTEPQFDNRWKHPIEPKNGKL